MAAQTARNWVANEGHRINKRLVDGLVADGRDRILWDSQLRGFGLRVSPLGRVTYILQYRVDGRERRYKIGKHGSPWTPETARQEARRLLGSVAEGDDPQQVRFDARAELSVSELCDLYIEEGLLTRKPSSVSAACSASRTTSNRCSAVNA